jgi:transmembrane exosortase EpsH
VTERRAFMLAFGHPPEAPERGLAGRPVEPEAANAQGVRRAAPGILVGSASLLALATILVFAALYADVFPALVRQWAAEEDYTHGFLILPLSL